MEKEEKMPDDINNANEDGIGGIEGAEEDEDDSESDEWLDLEDPDNRLDLKLEMGSSYSGDSDDQF